MTAPGESVKTPARDETRARHRDLAFLIPFGVFFALIAYGAFSPDLRLWGINHLAFYRPVFRYASLAIVALTFLPPLATRLYRWMARATSAMSSPIRVRRLALVGVFAASVAVFLSFRSATQLLGDGQLQAKLITRLAKSEDVDFAYYADFLAQEPVAPATNFVNFAAARALERLAGWEPVVTWQVLNAILGGMFMLLLLGFLSMSRLPTAFRILVVTAATATGGIQLFFGYIETYTPMIVAVTAYLIASFRTLHGKGGIALPTALFALAVVFHLQALLLGPSVFFLAAWVLGARRSSRHTRLLTGGVLAATVLGALVVALASGLNRFFLPLLGDDHLPGVLSFTHAADVLNQLALVIPIAPFLIGTAVARFRGSQVSGSPGGALAPAGAVRTGRRPQNSKRGSAAAHDAPTDRVEISFTLLVLAPCALFLFLFRPELGMARDWDLFVLPAAGFLVFGLTAAKRFAADPLSARYVERYLAPALAIALSIVVPWVGINASETRSVERYENIISFDATNPGYGLEILAMHYGDQGNHRMKAEVYDKAFAVSKNPRYLIAACSARLKNGEIDGPAAVLKGYIETNPDYHLAREVYIEALVRKGDMDGVIRVCGEGIARGPERPYYHFYLGIGHFTKGETDLAKKAFDECLRHSPPTVMVNAIRDMIKNPPPVQKTPPQ